jgi:hypothetical protein
MKRFRVEVKSLLQREGMNLRQFESRIRTLHPGVRTLAIRKIAEEGWIVIDGSNVRLK